MGSVRVGLVNMPFSSIYWPSIGLGLLKAGLASRGIASTTWNFNLRYAEMIGVKHYNRIADSPRETMLGEYLFVQSLHGDRFDDDLYVHDVLRGREHLEWAQAIRDANQSGILFEARNRVAEFMAECMEAAPWGEYDVIGFTSVFQQSVPSLTLARRIKEKFPDALVVFGGANVEGEMGEGLLQAFPFVDAICSGEGDRAFPDFVEKYLVTRSLPQVQGMLVRQEGAAVDGLPVRHTPAVMDLDALPYPDYTDYFEQLTAVRLDQAVVPRIQFETSRGCWWGERSHCVFCGLNGDTLQFRSKSSDRALGELRYLLDRYGSYTTRLSAVDNILDMKYFNDFIPALRELNAGLELFYETKANLRRDQLEALQDAGITMIQPGIESLDSDVLRRMKKGISGLQNIQLLKWCKEYGIHASWNFLWGFVGETPAQYEALAAMIPSLTHLEPPGGWGCVRLDRFSPYYYAAESFGLRNVRPFAAYRYMYPDVDDHTLSRMAYYFDFDYAEPQEVARYTGPLRSALGTWQAAYLDGSDLFSMHVDGADGLVIFDFRQGSQDHILALTPLQTCLYEACDSVRPARALNATLAEVLGREPRRDEVEHLLAPMLERRIMVKDGEQYLSLAIPAGRYTPANAALKRLAHLTERGEARVTALADAG